MKNNKGFTLIEVLITIVILTILVMVVTPIVTKYVEKTKIKAAETSANEYIKLIEKKYIKSKMDKNSLKNGLYTKKEIDALGLKYKGDGPIDACINLESGKVTYYSLKINDYTVSYYNNEKDITKNGKVSCEAEKIFTWYPKNARFVFSGDSLEPELADTDYYFKNKNRENSVPIIYTDDNKLSSWKISNDDNANSLILYNSELETDFVKNKNFSLAFYVKPIVTNYWERYVSTTINDAYVGMDSGTSVKGNMKLILNNLGLNDIVINQPLTEAFHVNFSYIGDELKIYINGNLSVKTTLDYDIQSLSISNSKYYGVGLYKDIVLTEGEINEKDLMELVERGKNYFK